MGFLPGIRMWSTTAEDGAWWWFALPTTLMVGRNATVTEIPGLWLLLSSLVCLVLACTILIRWSAPGGPAWGSLASYPLSLPGPRGWPVLGNLLDMSGLAHTRLAQLAQSHSASSLMAFSLGSTRAVLTCKPDVARELLNSTGFADRPIKRSARLLMFDRAIGFAPYGDYWRGLRRIAATHMFSPRRIAAHERTRQQETDVLLRSLADEMQSWRVVRPRFALKRASLNNIMMTVFGRCYSFGASCDRSAMELQSMVNEGYELLGAFNWEDHLPFLGKFLNSKLGMGKRCLELVSKVRVFVQAIIDEHREMTGCAGFSSDESSDFVDVLLSLKGSDKLDDNDMIAVLWEMIFRGTDTSAILTEWVIAEMVLNPQMQARLQTEIDTVVGTSRAVADSDIPHLTYLQAVVKETLRMHPPGPLLSWARLCTHDVTIAGHQIPAGTTAMVNMWAITHDPSIWHEPGRFEPERFLENDVDIRGNDLRLAPFGAGRRVCPGRALGMATVQLWVARLLHHYEWLPAAGHPVDLTEELKLSCEMKNPLAATIRPRIPVLFSSS